jgi:transposase
VSSEESVEDDASRKVVRSMVTLLGTLVKRIKVLTSALQHACAQSAMGRLILSFPRSGRTSAARVVAEFGDDPKRFTHRDHLASEAGLTRVTRASNKRHTVGSRYTCNKTVRNAMTTWANNSRKADPWANGIYQQACARGCRHPHAIRILARAWARVLHACWTHRTLHDPTRQASTTNPEAATC